jgi:hypothetical protein
MTVRIAQHELRRLTSTQLTTAFCVYTKLQACSMRLNAALTQCCVDFNTSKRLVTAHTLLDQLDSVHVADCC